MRSLIAVLCYASIAAFGGPAYSVQVVQSPAGFTNVSMQGINNSGQVAGYGKNGSVASQAFIGSPSGATALTLPSGWGSSYALAINNLGQVTGSGGAGPFVGSVSGSTPIPLPSSCSDAIGQAINDSGQVTGELLSVSQAFVGTTSNCAVVPLPPGFSGFLYGSIGSGINNVGQIAGSFLSGAQFQPFVGTVSGIALLPPLPPSNDSFGAAINDSGQVAGWFEGPSTQAFVGSATAVTVIPLPPGATRATLSGQSINNSGVVVGSSNAGGWIWDATHGTRLLNALVPSGWITSNGISISNNGLILAQGSLNGGATQYVELVPAAPLATPAPTTWMLVVIGLGMLPVVRRFSRRRV